MRRHLILTALIALTLSCSRTPERSARPRRATATTPPAATTPQPATPSATPSAAPTPAAAAIPQRWTGEADALPDAAQQASAIVVARLVALGAPAVGAPEVTAFNATRWTVDRALRGALEGGVSLKLRVQTLPADRVEQVPLPGQLYVVIVGGGSSDATEIRKLLPATPENLARIEQLAATR